MNCVIFGCGYLGLRVAQQWLEQGNHVIAVTRSADRATVLGAHGIEAVIADIAHSDARPALPAADVVLFAVGFDRSLGQSIDGVYQTGLDSALRAVGVAPRTFIYASTTGVYGDAAGEWVDERSTPNPQRPGARASLKAESRLAQSAIGERSVVLRFGGLYGPGRVPHLAPLCAGKPLAVPRDGWLNLVHVEDAARQTVAAGALLDTTTNRGQQVFNVVDDCPVRREDYYTEVARLTSAPPPSFVKAPPESPAAVRARSNRRVRNDRMKRELHESLAFPSYREGLSAIL